MNIRKTPVSARIGLVDDHPAVLLGVTAVLNTHSQFRVVGAASTVRTLLNDGATFDAVLLDLRLADNSSPTANVEALADAGAVVIAFTAGDEPALIREVARAGVAGMIRKTEPPNSIISALESALAGETVATPDWAAALIADQEFVDAQLTTREAEVLAHYASGLTADQVGAALFISGDTVLDHLRRIRKRYATVGRDAPTKVDLHRRAVEDGLV